MVREFSLLLSVTTGSGTTGYPDSVPGVKWLGSEFDHSVPSTAEVKGELSHNSPPPNAFTT